MGFDKDVAIIGAGPAGLALAAALCRRGRRVTVFERFDTPAPVGSGLMLQPTGLTVLHALGLGDEIAALGQRIERLHGLDARSARTVLDVRYDAVSGGRHGIGIHRAALFSSLFAAAGRAGATIVTGADITATDDAGVGLWLIDAADSRHGPFAFAVDASGARSRLAARFDAAEPPRELAFGAYWATLDAGGFPHDATALSQRYEAARIMVGVLPVGREALGGGPKIAFFWSQKVREADSVRAAGLAAFKARVLETWPALQPLTDQIIDWDQLTLARYRHRTLRRPHQGRLVFIGDAAHSTSPQLGQGANMALLDVAALLDGLDRHDDVGLAFAHYARSRLWHVRIFQMLSLVFTPFYQSDSALIAMVRDRLVASLARVPPMPGLLALIVSGLLAGPFRGTGLAERVWTNALEDGNIPGLRS